jgi:hypothetical protein
MKIIVEIDAVERECGECTHLIILRNYCNLYEECFNAPELAEHQHRLPACLAAEQEYLRLKGGHDERKV